MNLEIFFEGKKFVFSESPKDFNLLCMCPYIVLVAVTRDG